MSHSTLPRTSARPVKIISGDPRFLTVQKGMNERWPNTSAMGADRVYVCRSADEVLTAANDAIVAGFRITVRSGGHCYEGFVSNKLEKTEKLAIIDLGEMKGFACNLDLGDSSEKIASLYEPIHAYNYAIYTGSQNWDSYVSMYKLTGKTIPGGSCYSVGVGGHFSGGGYGLLSRLHGCVVDWVTGVDILIPNQASTALEGKHVRADSPSQQDRDLFRACLGAGGGNFGIVIRYYFDQLPDAPQQVYWLTLSWDWTEFTRESFGTFLKAYFDWFKANELDATSQDPLKNNGGLFSALKLQHESFGPIVLAVQYTNGVTGLVGGDNDLPLISFLSAMQLAAPSPGKHFEKYVHPNITPLRSELHGQIFDLSKAFSDSWLAVTMLVNGSGPTLRGKYKSAYQKGQFTEVAIDGYYDALTTKGGIGSKLPKGTEACVFQIDSYGGAVNTKGMGNTAVTQRASVLKTQHQIYWRDIVNQIDSQCVAWMRDAYESIHADQLNKRPSQGAIYEGCYINYPDIDMLAVNGQPTKDWLDLYYSDGTQNNVVNVLLNLKKSVDKRNIFRHAMSIPVEN